MADIYYDDHMLGIFGMVANYCYDKGFDKQWVNAFWEGLQQQPKLYDEFIHFFDTGELIGQYELHGFTVLDTFVYAMELDSVIYDTGRSGASCNKDKMVLCAFSYMIHLYQEPERYTKILSEDQRTDHLS